MQLTDLLILLKSIRFDYLIKNQNTMINKNNFVSFLKEYSIMFSAMITLDFLFSTIPGAFKGESLNFTMSVGQLIIWIVFSALVAYFNLRKQRRKELETG